MFMKNALITLGLLMSLNSFANIEHVDDELTRPAQVEIESNRACFRELETQGCGDPGDDVSHFRSCMNNVFVDLSKNCQRLMKDLYQ
jgi:hypothetical protein